MSLAWARRRLMDAGKKAASLRLYHRALAAAVEGGLSRSATPRFGDDPKARRYFLPGEDAVRDIVAELTSREGLAFGEWSAALPRNPTVLLATVRLLREQGRTEADTLLRDLLRDGAAVDEPDVDDPRQIAARAEALCLESRWKEAADAYRQAIERVDNDLIRARGGSTSPTSPIGSTTRGSGGRPCGPCWPRTAATISHDASGRSSNPPTRSRPDSREGSARSRRIDDIGTDGAPARCEGRRPQRKSKESGSRRRTQSK